MKWILLILALGLSSCGQQEREEDRDKGPTEMDRIYERLKVLELLGNSLGSLVESEFKSCADTGALHGKDLAKKICQIAQAATIETQAELLAKIQLFNKHLVDKIEALSGQMATLDSDVHGENGIIERLDDIDTQLTSLEGLIDALEARMDEVEADIASLEGDITAINNSILSINDEIADLTDQLADVIDNLDTAMTYVEIGTENILAGPMYESVLRRVDKSVIVAYTEAYGVAVTITGCSATNGSPQVSCSTNAAHGYSPGSNVYLVGITGGRGLSASDLTGDFVLKTGTTGSTIVFDALKNATQNGNLGGSQGSAKEVIGRAMRSIWLTADGADVAVRTTSLGNKRYNFIIRVDGFICYDETDHSATFATIEAEGADIVCK